MILQGPRLLLRPLEDDDAADFAALNADPVVMRDFAKPLGAPESDAFRARLAAHFEQHGFGFWGVFRRGEPGLIGLVGLLNVAPTMPFAPAVEIGWRIAAAHHRRGYAEEAARLALAAGFGPLRLQEIVAFTIPANAPSRALMNKLGMVADGGFEHPNLPEGHPMRPHLLYRIARGAWIRDRL
ncbi:MAG: GCN5-related N-acetyltransferase [Rubritepida sp.]|nr:GCN5-related N-acetyltransferase [Rubritepida sp.]